MLPFMCFVAICYGMTNIIVNGNIFKGLRVWCKGHRSKPLNTLGSMICCMMCCGFWVGILVGMCYPLTAFPCRWFSFTDGCVSSGMCWVIHVTMVRLGANKL